MESLIHFTQKLPSFALAGVVFLIWLIALWFVKRLVFHRLHQWASRSKNSWHIVLVNALSFPADFFIVASGLVILAGFLPLPKEFSRVATMVLQGCVIVTVAVFLDRALLLFLDRYAQKNIFSHISHSFARGVMRGFVVVISVLIFLDLLGISITPILASLGIGSLAVALALQDTLSNFFAGLYMAVDRPVEVGHFVKLEGGQEGFISDVGWRSTRIWTPNNNTVVIPNSKLMGSVITNYDLPNREMAVTVEVEVHYQSDLNRVEKVTQEVACEVLKTVAGGLAAFEPIIFFHTFGESGIRFTVVLRTTQFTDAPRIKHEFIKRLHVRYEKEKILIPYPTRTVYLNSVIPAVFKRESNV